MLICPLILTQLTRDLSQGKAPCIPATLSDKGQHPFSPSCCVSKRACIPPSQHSSCVSCPAVSAWSRWDCSPVTAHGLWTLPCAACVRVETSEGYPSVPVPQHRLESFPHKAVLHAFPSLHACAQRNYTSARLLCELLCPFSCHHPRLLACLPYPKPPCSLHHNFWFKALLMKLTSLGKDAFASCNQVDLVSSKQLLSLREGPMVIEPSLRLLIMSLIKSWWHSPSIEHSLIATLFVRQKVSSENLCASFLKVVVLNSVIVICRCPKVIHSNQDSDCFSDHWRHSSILPTHQGVGQTAWLLLMNKFTSMAFGASRTLEGPEVPDRSILWHNHKWTQFDTSHFQLLA